MTVEITPPPVSPPPVPASANWKPLVAAVFACVLALTGAWSSRRRPWKGRSGSKWMAAAFCIASLPFVLAEVATGVVSFATGLLSIPPVIGIGTAVDVGILVAGVAVAVGRLRVVRSKRGRAPASVR